MADGNLAQVWEQTKLIRSRFQKEWPWIQWPYQAEDADGDDDDDDPSKEKHPVCTKSLQLNIAAVDAMLEFCHGEFVDIHWLQNEARIMCLNTLATVLVYAILIFIQVNHQVYSYI